MELCNPVGIMEAEQIDINDWYRILIGQVPLTFIIETLIRSAIIYALLLVSIRLLGSRMAGQLSKNEMISITTLAAAIGVPLQAPDRGIIPSFIIAAIVILIGRLVSAWAARSPRFETLSQDKLSILVEDSVLQLAQMRKTRITRERLFAYLRSQGIIHLGQVKRAYLEAGGTFTMVCETVKRSGLSVIPPQDTEFLSAQVAEEDLLACANCGALRQNLPAMKPCPSCDKDKWERPLKG
jgi:uncharacterized membrane protein YcaP (DUF421 family)